MRTFFSMAKNSFMAWVVYRMHIVFSILTNILYVILAYFLWKAIYENSTGTLNGMTFNQTFIYLSCAASLFILFQTHIDWNLSQRIINGHIIMDLLKPFDFQLQLLSKSTGMFFSNLFIITIPAFLVIIFVFKAAIPFGINLLFFPLSLLLAYLISSIFDFCNGLFTFYTESIWGIYAVKESMVLFLSGALIPLKFFPIFLRRILMVLPFQAIYNIPLTILTANNILLSEYLGMIGIQFFWLVVFFLISRLFFRIASRVLTINGG